MPRYVHSARLLALFLGLVAGGLASCQRASYSFQAPAPPAYYAPAVAPNTVAQLLVYNPLPVVGHPRRRLFGRPSRRPAAHRVPASHLATLLAGRGVARAMAARPAQVPTLGAEPVRQRSRGIALLLALVPLLLGLPLGLHNFYLGYHGRGILTVLFTAAALVLLSVAAFFALLLLFGQGSGVVLALFILAALLYYGIYIWQIIDVVRIITGDLKPKDGVYYQRFFQTHE